MDTVITNVLMVTNIDSISIPKMSYQEIVYALDTAVTMHVARSSARQPSSAQALKCYM